MKAATNDDRVWAELAQFARTVNPWSTPRESWLKSCRFILGQLSNEATITKLSPKKNACLILVAQHLLRFDQYLSLPLKIRHEIRQNQKSVDLILSDSIFTQLGALAPLPLNTWVEHFSHESVARTLATFEVIPSPDGMTEITQRVVDEDVRGNIQPTTKQEQKKLLQYWWGTNIELAKMRVRIGIAKAAAAHQV